MVLHYKLQQYINKILNSKNHPHLLIYGPEGSGKKYLLKNALKINNFNNYSYEKLEYKKNKTNYLFDSYNINKYKSIFKEIIHDICKSVIQNNIIHIFITNSEQLHSQILNFLRKFLEFNFEICRFIFFTNTLVGQFQPIKSRCLFIRVPYPPIEEYKKFIHHQCKNISISYENTFLDERNIQKMLDILLLRSIKADFNDNIDIFCKNILDNINDHKKINILVHNIIKNGYDSREVMKKFALYVHKQEIYKIIAKYDHLLAMGYRELVHMEALFYNIHLLLKK